ncbi:MAG: tRNA (adenosine(37)-N6)-threonylcarbamoyltransferase complex transferase subunit TsaD [Chlamydiia bacterium]|nr:tRNA (adenosine(37)-N6)-threonylcarbamoyltransferase complex transferase subunit TsaD [Chlamydiia bacterium]
MLVLGIETTCDETAASLVRDGHEILSNVVASSADIHALYGGVFPELACRRHIDALIPVLTQALIPGETIDLIAVSKGPGLIGALLVGMQAAKGLSIAWHKPLIGINHVEAHLYSAFISFPQSDWLFPSLGIVLSGGHTFLVKISGIGQYELLGTTADDAIGEAFDKVATLLGLPYPGGPPLEMLARKGDPTRFSFSPGKVKKNPLNFSLSGLKTAVFYALQNLVLDEQNKADLAAAFQETAFTDVASKAAIAIQRFPCRGVYLGGGVCNNQRLKEILADRLSPLPIFWPPPELTLDNAAMIAGLGFHKFRQTPVSDPLDLDVQTRIPVV